MDRVGIAGHAGVVALARAVVVVGAGTEDVDERATVERLSPVVHPANSRASAIAAARPVMEPWCQP